MSLPSFQPLPLERRPEPFSHPEWVYELKLDGFRALAYLERGEVRLISRNANPFKSFPELATALGEELAAKTAVLDGEIVALDGDGCAQFNQLLFRRGTPRFCAFDVLFLDGQDIRSLSLVERKRALRSILPSTSKYLLHVDHVVGYGERLFQLVCERDLEGIVAKHRHSRYTTEDNNPAWVKIKNRNYSQVIGRHELFEREPEQAYHAGRGWDSCAQVCAQMANLA